MSVKNGKPLYQQIEDYILDKIESHEYKEGDTIPTEKELCKLFNTSRATVNKALNHLVINGVIYRTPGRGSFVRMHSFEKQIQKLMGFNEQMKMLNQSSSTNILSYSQVNANRLKKAKEAFDLKDDDFIHYIERIRCVNNEPIAVECIALSPKVIKEMNISQIKDSLYEFIEDELKLKIGTSDFVISAVQGDNYILGLFPMEVNQPLLKYIQTTYLIDGRVFEYNEIYYLSDKYEYHGRNYR